jgi:predicted fused transcriptional regulator/phosphomethylpyrimidine kinase
MGFYHVFNVFVPAIRSNMCISMAIRAQNNSVFNSAFSTPGEPNDVIGFQGRVIALWRGEFKEELLL